MCHRVDPSFRVDRLVATRESKRARPSLFWFFQIERDPRGRRRVKVGHQQDLNAGTWTRSSGIASGNTNDATRRTIRFDVTARTDRTHPAVSRTMLSFDFSPCLEGRVRFLAFGLARRVFRPPEVRRTLRYVRLRPAIQQIRFFLALKSPRRRANMPWNMPRSAVW